MLIYVRLLIVDGRC